MTENLKQSMDNMTDLTFRGFQKRVDDWIKNYSTGYFPPLTNMAILTEETGEVARVMARLYGGQRSKPTDRADINSLAEELADVVRVCCAIANQTGIDLEQALLDKDLVIRKRDSII